MSEDLSLERTYRKDFTTTEADFGDWGNKTAKEEAEILQHLTALSKTSIYFLSFENTKKERL